MGVVSASEVERARRELPADIFECEYEAKRVSREGLIYREFSDTSILPVGVEPPGWRGGYGIGCVCGVDFGYEHPSVFVVVQHNDKKDTFWVREARYLRHGSEQDHLRVALNLKSKYDIADFFCDWNRGDYVDRFRKERIKARLADKDVLRGIDDVRKLMVVSGLLGRPKIYFSSSMSNDLIKEIRGYTYKEGTNVPNKRAGNDDGLDALRYAITGIIGKQGLIRDMGV